MKLQNSVEDNRNRGLREIERKTYCTGLISPYVTPRYYY